MKSESNVINDYRPRFYSEISNAFYGVDREMIRYFKSQKIEDKINIRTGRKLGPEFSRHKTEFEMFEESIINIFNIRFLYEMSFLEAFLKDYLIEQGEDKSSVVSAWDRFNSSNKTIHNNKSKSLLNLQFVRFLINELFKINITLSPLHRELGTLRNCIIHNGGLIKDERDLQGLECTLKKLKLKQEIGEKILLTEIVYSEIMGFSLNIILELGQLNITNK